MISLSKKIKQVFSLPNGQNVFLTSSPFASEPDIYDLLIIDESIPSGIEDISINGYSKVQVDSSNSVITSGSLDETSDYISIQGLHISCLDLRKGAMWQKDQLEFLLWKCGKPVFYGKCDILVDAFAVYTTTLPQMPISA